MSIFTSEPSFALYTPNTVLEQDFPIVEVGQVAEQESWRKEINRPIYHIHKWWATRLGSVFRGLLLGALSEPGTDVWDAFYQRHAFKDKVVLDPFMGSGTTLGEAAKLGAKAIGCDTNPVSTFLARQAFTRVSEQQLRAAFAWLENSVAHEIRRYYQTRDPLTGESIPALYYFWVKVVRTPEGEEIPLFDKYVFAKNAYPKKKPKAQIVCPNCWAIIESRYDTKELTCPDCSLSFNPQIGPVSGKFVTDKSGKRYRIRDLLPKDGSPPAHRLYAVMALRSDGQKVYLRATEEDIRLFAEAETRLRAEDLPLPTMKVRPGHNTDQARGYNYTSWRDFFNSRQLLALGLLLRAILEIQDQTIQEQLLCLFSSTLEFNNMFCSFKGEGTGAVRHMFANHILKPERTPLENSVWGTPKSSGTFSTLFESRLIPAKRYLDDPFEVGFQYDIYGERKGSQKITASDPINVTLVETWEELEKSNNSLMILNGDSAKLPLPDKTVDAVVTDPPYFDFIHYSELSDFFFAWLSPVLHTRYPWFDKADSSAKGEVQSKDPRVFARQLSLVLIESNRVLKDTGVLAFSFHHSRPEGWAAICEAIAQAGFIVVAAHPIHAEFRASNPKSAAKNPINLDAILVCKKRTDATHSQTTFLDVHKRAQTLLRRFEKAGMHLSSADHFVIYASQMLIPLSEQFLDFDSACNEIRRCKEQLSSKN